MGGHSTVAGIDWPTDGNFLSIERYRIFLILLFNGEKLYFIEKDHGAGLVCGTKLKWVILTQPNQCEE